MEIFAVVVLSFLLAVGWIVMHGKIERLEEQIAELTARIFRLESERPSERVIAKPAAPATQLVPIPEATAPTPTPPHSVEPVEARPILTPGNVSAHIRAPAPGLGERIRKVLGDEEWEALLGGSLLNKIGALVLVIGVALFLGYSFTHMTPVGRALTSLGGSLCLLAGGVFLERTQTYRIFARGLIGAGWAALYVTAYAIYAVPAARLIENPFVGSALLLIVAAGMIGHSLLYRVQAITAVAYFAAFAALGVTPLSSFALLSLVPLVVSLLYLAYRFEWNTMALFGVVATYATCIWRGSSGASLLAAECLLLVYWLLFEAFDLLRVRRRASSTQVELVFPLNAIAFLGLSYQAWSTHNPGGIWEAYAFFAVLYLVSAVARSFLRPPSSFAGDTDLAARMRAGSYEAPVTLAAALTGFAIAKRAVGVWLGAGFAIEAEILYLAGTFLNLAFLRWLGSIGFFFSLARLLINDIATGQKVAVAGSGSINAATPSELFHAMLFYVNRLLRKPNRIYSSLAAALIAIVMAQELPEQFIATGWLVFAAVLFELGLRKRLTEFRFQAYALAAAGVVAGISFHIVRTWPHPWIPLACALVLVFAFILRVRLPGSLTGPERNWLDIAGAAAITSLTLLLVWNLAPVNYRGVYSCLLALALFELGAIKLPAALVRFSYAAMTTGALIVLAEESSHFLKPAPNYVWISYAGAAFCLYLFSERAGKNQPPVQVLASSGAVLTTLATLWLVLPEAVIAPAWSAVAVLLFMLGLRRDLSYERWQAYLVMLASVLDAWQTNLRPMAGFVVLACYLAQFLSPKEGKHFPDGWLGYVEKYPRAFWSLLGTLLLTTLLWHQLPGGLLTTALGIEGLSLLGAGFPLRERVLRLEGLTLLLICILKLFLYDLRNLETLYRILSFVALGLILLGVSWIYTRFRERVSRYL
jgi:uncharacterized membrane protein